MVASVLLIEAGRGTSSNWTYSAVWIAMLGTLILWAYGVRFYWRVQQRLGVVRSAVYLAIVVGFMWLSPLLFMAIEGRRKFLSVIFKVDTDPVLSSR
jgi:hypothetical protein